MIHHLSRILINILILLSCSFSLPGGHNHQRMAAAELTMHLRLYHSLNQELLLPQRWHSHSPFPVPMTEHNHIFPAVENDEEGFPKRKPDSRRGEKDFLAQLSLGSVENSAGIPDFDTITPRSRTNCTHFWQLSVLLI